jgi:hypothetical protein
MEVHPIGTPWWRAKRISMVPQTGLERLKAEIDRLQEANDRGIALYGRALQEVIDELKAGYEQALMNNPSKVV